MPESKHTNRLIGETSPYLLQHAHNPVDWRPWGKEALTKAQRENKPILLSIGYSACHWCHVMAHESFEDENTAKVMNELFVNIKVDREERPDLDKIYQSAYQLLFRRAGGWPLTMFLTPDDHAPFFGGTYFPKEPRYGMPAFEDILRRVADFYRQNQHQVREQNDSLAQALRSDAWRRAKTGGDMNPAPLQDARDQLVNEFDPVHGGFSAAPKFPHPTSLDRLLRHWAASVAAGAADEKAGHAVFFTLRKMAEGGIYDHVGGGFCRYSVDERWMIPHFEKMLYDNGPLLSLYSQAFRASGEVFYKQVAEQTAEWAMREMQSPEGGFYSSLDADSEGEEGKFYVWTPEQAQSVLSPEQYLVFANRFGLDGPANFEGRWHLRVCTDLETVAQRTGSNVEHVYQVLEDAKKKLFAEREKRVRPGRDEKILTAWNGLMIKGLAAASRHLERQDFADAAEKALDFVRERLWRDGRLLAVHKDGRSHLSAYLDDYAFLIDAILELLQVRWRDGDLDFALELADVLLEHYQDPNQGGFFFTADDHERLIQRPKPLFDEALPAGNGIAAHTLIRLGHLLNSARLLAATERTLKWAWPAIESAPVGCNALLLALNEYLHPGQTVIIRGEAAAIEAWRRGCARPYAPRRLCLAVPIEAIVLPEALAEKKPYKNVPTAYVCTGAQCSAPITRLVELETILAQSEVDAR